MSGYVLRASCLAVIAVLVIAATYGLLIVWASQKPDRPAACAGLSAFECTALVQEELQ